MGCEKYADSGADEYLEISVRRIPPLVPASNVRRRAGQRRASLFVQRGITTEALGWRFDETGSDSRAYLHSLARRHHLSLIQKYLESCIWTCFLAVPHRGAPCAKACYRRYACRESPSYNRQTGRVLVPHSMRRFASGETWMMR